MEPVPLKYGKLATKYTWIYGYSLQFREAIASPRRPPIPGRAEVERLLLGNSD